MSAAMHRSFARMRSLPAVRAAALWTTALACAFMFAPPALAAPGEQRPGQAEAAGQAAESSAAPLSEDQFLDLVSAYQGGYFQLAAVSAFQVYSAAGLIDGSFRAGFIDGPTALDLLGQNSLLHSVCYSTLDQIHSLTPPDDAVAQGEMARLNTVLNAEGVLLSALGDLFAAPGDVNAAAADKARAELEKVLDSFMGPEEEVGGDSGGR
jgi:hypothetical protein